MLSSGKRIQYAPVDDNSDDEADFGLEPVQPDDGHGKRGVGLGVVVTLLLLMVVWMGSDTDTAPKLASEAQVAPTSAPKKYVAPTPAPKKYVAPTPAPSMYVPTVGETEKDEDLNDSGTVRLAEPEEEPHFQVNDSLYKVRKSVTWENARVLFFAGLRHTGQPTIMKALDAVCKDSIKNECVRLCTFTDPRWVEFMEFNNYEELLDEFADELASARQKYAARNNTKNLVFLADLYGSCEEEVGLSYPVSLQYLDPGTMPDIAAFARAAEGAGVDFRVVSMLDVNLETTVKRWFETFHFSPYAKTSFHVLRTLQEAYESLWGGLTLIDKKFWMSLDTAKWKPLLTRGESIDEFTGLTGLGAALTKFKKTPYRTKATEIDSALSLSKEDEKYIPRLRLSLKVYSDLLKLDKNEPIVKKTVLSTASAPRPRVLFFAGLEGTGHHLFQTVFNKLSQETDIVRHGCSMTEFLYRQGSKKSMFETTTSENYNQAYDAFKASLRDLKNDSESIGKAYLLNIHVGCKKATGEMSYPNFGGKFKAFQHPDVVSIALAAEEAGVDLQVVVLNRDAEKIMVSTTVHRHFGGSRQLNVLEPVAYALLQQLQMLEPDYITACANFGDPDLSYVPRMETVLRLPTLRENMELVMRPSSGQPEKDKYKDLRQRRIMSFNATTYAILKFCPNDP